MAPGGKVDTHREQPYCAPGFGARQYGVTDEPQPPDLKDLSDRLSKARRREDRSPDDARPEPNQMGLALQVITEMAAALFVGGLLGWLVDTQFGTRPWGLLILLVLGAVAGMRGAFRKARQYGGPADGAPGQE